MTASKTLNITLILASKEDDPLKKAQPFMPLSLPILASLAPEHHYIFIDMMRDSEKINFDDNSDIVGISLRQSSEETAFYLASEYKKRGKTIVFGGPQPSAAPYIVANYADSVVVGEAEELWPVLLGDYQKKELKKFYVCSPEKFDSKEESCFQIYNYPDLGNLPLPNRNIFKSKYTFDMVFASRGCPIACDFCMVSDIFGKKIRLKPIENVLNEINQFKKFFYLLDDTVFGRPDCYDYYINLYEKMAKLSKKRYWTGQANLDAASTEKGREVIKAAAKAGLVYAAIGVESVNTSTLLSSGSINKMGAKDNMHVIEKMKENIAFIQAQGIFISGWFTIGYEGDTEQTYYDTIDFCKATNIMPVITPIRALKGSRLFKKLSREGKIQPFENNVSNIKHDLLGNIEVRRALNITTDDAYNSAENFKRIKFFNRNVRKTNRNFTDTVYRTIFAYITQKKMNNIVRNEIKNF